MRSKYLLFLPFLYIIIVWVAFSYPYFFQQKVPFPSTYQVNSFFPWKEYQKFWGPVKSGAMPDVIDQIYPWRHFTIQELKQGQIPYWNPNNFSGTPHLANFQSAVFSPFNLLFFLLPFVDAWSIMILLQPILAGLFTYLLLREFKISRAGSLLSSITYMFCGFFVVWMAYGSLSMAISFLPLSLFLIEKCFNKKKTLFLVLLSLVLPLSFFSGHFQTSLYLFLFSLLYIFFKRVETQKNREFFLTLLFFSLGLILSLPQLLPSIQLYSNSVRSETYITGGGIPFFYLVTSFAPDFFGNPVTRNDWLGYYAEWASFVGIIPLFLAFFIPLRNKKVLLFLIIGIVSLLLSIDSPFQKIIGSLRIPVLSTSTPSRIVVIFSFSLAVLAGFGFDNLRQLIKKKSYKRLFIPIGIMLSVLLCIWFLLFLVKPMPVDKLLTAKKNFILPTGIFLATFFFIFVSLFRRKWASLILIGILFLATFDSLRFAIKWMPFDRKDFVFQDLPVISSMKKNVGLGRVYGNLGAHVDTYYNIPSIQGYDPLYIGRYGEFLASAKSGMPDQAGRSVAQLVHEAKYIDRVLDFLGVTVIFHPTLDTKKPWAYPVWQDTKRFTKVFDDGKYQLYRNNTARDKMSLFYSYETIQDKDKILNRFYSDEFDFRTILILEEKIPVKLEKGEGEVKITTYSPQYIKAKVTSTKTALLFITDNYYPGWRAKVNGREAKIYRADYSFRSILVPKGNSVVEFNYVLDL